VLTERLVQRWKDCAAEDWPWFEDSVTYENARFSQALILSGQWMPHPEAGDRPQITALAGVDSEDPVRLLPSHRQQRLLTARWCACGLRSATRRSTGHGLRLPEAFRATGDDSWSREARRAFEWFLGRNDLGVPLYDLHHRRLQRWSASDRVNENQGAESTLAFHLALAEMTTREHLITPARSSHPLMNPIRSPPQCDIPSAESARVIIRPFIPGSPERLPRILTRASP
jgi:hypothetical protein